MSSITAIKSLQFKNMNSKTDPMRAAWYAFGAGIKQNEIAKLLHLSRPKVNRILSSSKVAESIQYSIEGEPEYLLELEHGLTDKYSLESCIVSSQPASSGNLAHLGGEHMIEAGAQLIHALIINLGIQHVGLGKGRTIREITQSLVLPYSDEYEWIALQGCLGLGYATNPFDIIEDLCTIAGGEGYLLPLPAVEFSSTEASASLKQPGASQVLELAKNASLYIFSIGAIENTPHLHEIFGLKNSEIQALKNIGAVGDVLGHFIDSNGDPIISPVCPTALAVPLSQLKLGRRLVVAGGAEKSNAIRAALQGGYVSDLVTDATTAHLILNGG